ncbi:glycosyltransferase family 2 protein [Pectinatus brassicae]|uniref:Glycosyltransferase involved in cell wall biosynthesis n=1 Tax=Pectinatus brassicae TaxID=862415 RepID=A0A840UIJ9_9FIRM|nr:glycosyltransferase family 2 protein [Pectinatus brassicae]MBB5336809.1 glycosyltransferase involved in cell wall biosynthesis [Pectinatus brassicae]
MIKDYKDVLPEADIYVYDNNSSDGTDLIARQMGAIVRYEYRQGKGNVIRSMFRDINADCYLMIDGDNTYPAENARTMCDLVLQGKADMVIGDRLSSTYFEENKRPFHNIGNLMVRKCINMFWHTKQTIVDVMTGYRTFSPIFVKSFPILSQGFEVETEMTIHALDKNLLIESIPVQYRDRPSGSESKLNTYSDGIKVLFTIFNLYRNYKPLKFFGVAAFIAMIFAMILFAPVFIEYLETGLVPRVPTLIVSVILMLTGFLSSVCGLILDTIANNSRKNFELQMNIIKMMLK